MIKSILTFLTLNIFVSASCNIESKILNNCNFSGKNFENYNFSKKNMSNIDFTNANLFGAIFNKTQMKNINFNNANLFGAFFVEATLNNINFSNSDISSADFTGATISSTSFMTATQEDTIFGKMIVEKPDIIKVGNCKVIIDNEKKADWSVAMLGLTIDAGHSDKFIIGGLCKWHSGATFKFNSVTSLSKQKKKFSFTYNSCDFPVYVSIDNKNIHLEDMYNQTCLKSKNTSSSSNIYCSNLSSSDYAMCMGMSGQTSYCNSFTSNGRDMNMCRGVGGESTYCNYLNNDRDINMCKGMSGQTQYCNYLKNDRDIHMCKGNCNFLQSSRDVNMCKGIWKK